MASLDQGQFDLDSTGFLGVIQQKADMFRRGYAAGKAQAEPLSPAGLLFAGMGGSGVGAELVRDACTRVMDLPVTIVRHYTMPNHVKSDWHVLAVSYSGSTEETLSVAQRAKQRGVPVTSFATGGKLAKLAGRNVPQHVGTQPRQATGHAWASILGFLDGSGILLEPVPVNRAVEAIHQVDEVCGPHVPEEKNKAKQMARLLADPIPQIYATPSFYGVAHFFRAMLNENAKKIAGWEQIPECNHNDLSGWGGDADHRKSFAAVFLNHSEQIPEMDKRIKFMQQRMDAWGLPWTQRVAGPIHRFRDHVVEQARAIQFFDYVAYYTAMIRGQDPAQIHDILALKEFLRS